ncbi:MAG: POTRA domain protein, FtsQ-type [Candidatus Magasanikbacteria bacterium GW2011_GWA2_42_32]|uniref:POTRA domain protein, FtsQ-type n=1 Tax=Candidatus Magasanikbacteria bacterium GW2011_GWA2_42_32 TaxID=1619039 RepID=A0A0G1CD11_9BACT|nr:MAG: POTRA domain protein, FtsQ-type [Candidatus Magasanikbacteria bacterium GW2011_GWA2_42_32]
MLRHRGYKSYHTPKKNNNWKNFFAWFKIGRGYKWNLPRDVSGKMFHNPYLNKKHLPRRTRAPRIKITIGAISLLTIVGILAFHHYFNIKQVSIVGLERISNNELNNLTNRILDAKRFWFFNGRNYFIINTSKIEKEIKSTYALENLKIKSSFPNKIEISVKEKQAKLLLENSLAQLNGEPKNHYYLIDSEGKVIQEVDPADINNSAYLNLLMLKTQEIEKFVINQSVIVPAAVQFLLFAQEKIPEKTNINISFVELDKDGGVVNLTKRQKKQFALY